MNRFQKAVKSAVPGPRGGQMTHALMLALGIVSEDESGLEVARGLSEDFLEAAVSAYFALRDLEAEGSVKADDVPTKIKAPLTREFFVFEILADDELPDSYSLSDIDHLTGDGPFVGSFGYSFSRRVDPVEMANALEGAGSDPSFFRLYDERD